jgi:hypothetical protein
MQNYFSGIKRPSWRCSGLLALTLLIFICSAAQANSEKDENAGEVLETAVDEIRVAGTVEIKENTPEENDPKEAIQPAIDDVKAIQAGQPVSEKAASDLTKVLLFGQVRSTYDFVSGTMRRLHFPQFGDRNYTVRVSPIPFPNAMINPETRETTIDLGLFSIIETTDEFAFVVAHEATHGNPDLLKALKDDPEIERILESIPEVQGLSSTQREEIRADLGAIRRMIEAGYNPWAGYNIQFKFAKMKKDLKKKGFFGSAFINLVRTVAKGSESYFSTHPDPAVRMLAIKAYIVYMGNKTDLSEIVSSYERLPLAISLLRVRAKAYSFPFTSKWFGRGIDLLFAKQLLYPYLEKGLHALAKSNPIAYDYINKNYIHYGEGFLNFAKGYIPSFVWDGRLEHLAYNGIMYVPAGALGLVFGYLILKNNKILWAAIKKVPGHLVKIPEKLYSSLADKDPLIKDFERYRAALEKNEQIEIDPLVTWVSESISEVQSTLEKTPIVIGGRGSGKFITMLNRALNSKRYPRKLARQVLQVLATFVEQAEPDQVEKLRLKLSPVTVSILLYDDKILTHEKERAAVREVLEALTGRGLPEVSIAAIRSTLEKARNGRYELDKIIFKMEQLLSGKAPADEKKKIAESYGRKIYEQFEENAKFVEDLIAVDIFIYENFAKFSIEEKIDLLSDLNWSGQNHIVADLLNANHQNILSELYSRENSKIGLIDKLKAIYVDLSLSEDEGKIFGQVRLWRAELQKARTQRNKSADYLDTLGIASLAKTVAPVLDYGRLSNGKRAERKDTEDFLAYLEKNITTLSGLKEFVHRDLLPRHVIVNTYSTELSALVLKHPEWIKSASDIDVLLSEDYLWKRFDDSSIRMGTVEAQIRDHLVELMANHPEVWKHEPGRADEMHQLILAKRKEFGIQAKTSEEMFMLWARLSSQGVTTTSDSLLSEIYDKYIRKASSEQRAAFANSILVKSHQLWEPSLKDALVQDYMAGHDSYKALLKTPVGENRIPQIQGVIDELLKVAQARSAGTAEFLENMSVAIRSTREEADLIERAKYPKSGEKVEDAGLRTLSLMIDKVLNWKTGDQWDLILFLKGDIEPTEHIKKAFQLVGAERIRRTFTMMPTVARAAFIDMILSDPRGINPASRGLSRETKRIVSYILDQTEKKSREIAEDLFDSLLYSLRATGNENLQNFYLSCMLAYPKSQFARAGRILREFLDNYGTLGRKLGQFIAAAEVLPEEDTKELRELQENASKPTRARVYKDRDATNDPRLMNAELGKVLGGGASKYAALIGTDKVFKQLRSETIAHTNMEFRQAEEMGNHLVSKDRKKYGVLKRLIQASIAAVKREIDPHHEVDMSRIARDMYSKLSTEHIHLESPHEELITDTAILADFANGSSFSGLSEADKVAVAKANLKTEDKILFKDFNESSLELSTSNEKVYFDPDRHWGNAKNEVRKARPVDDVFISNLDFGQLQLTTVRERSQMVHLFALAQVAAETGATKWAVAKVAEMYDMDAETRVRLYKTMGEYFPSSGKPITVYYGLLSAIQDAGVEIGMQYYDFLRAQVQLNPTASLLGVGATHSPLARTERYVRRLVNKWKPEIRVQMTISEKLKYWVRSKSRDASTCSALLGA